MSILDWTVVSARIYAHVSQADNDREQENGRWAIWIPVGCAFVDDADLEKNMETHVDERADAWVQQARGLDKLLKSSLKKWSKCALLGSYILLARARTSEGGTVSEHAWFLSAHRSLLAFGIRHNNSAQNSVSSSRYGLACVCGEGTSHLVYSKLKKFVHNWTKERFLNNVSQLRKASLQKSSVLDGHEFVLHSEPLWKADHALKCFKCVILEATDLRDVVEFLPCSRSGRVDILLKPVARNAVKSMVKEESEKQWWWERG